MHIHNTN